METLTLVAMGASLTAQPRRLGVLVPAGATWRVTRSSRRRTPARCKTSLTCKLAQRGRLRECARVISTHVLHDEEDVTPLLARIAIGPVEPAEPPTPLFANLVSRLRVAGIEARERERERR